MNNDYRTWLPKLSPRGIILFHDTNVRNRDTFGVYKLWDEISTQYVSFHFLHGCSLGVIAVSHNYPARLVDLFECGEEQADPIRTKSVSPGKQSH